MNRQQALDTVSNHLIRQGRRSDRANPDPSFGPERLGAYRGPHGYKCAIGSLIKDEFYSPALESAPAQREVIMEAVSKSLGAEVTEDDSQFLMDLQYIHDHIGPSRWRIELRRLSKEYGLKFQPEY